MDMMNWLQILLASDLWAIVLAQATPTPSPSPSPRAIDPATVELLKSQLQFLQDANSRLTTSFNIFVALISAVTTFFVAIAAWLFKRTLTEAKQEVDQLVKAEVKRQIAVSVKDQVDYLEQALQREKVLSLVTVDYVLQTISRVLPVEYRLLNARFPRLQFRKLDSRDFRGDVVVLDLVSYQSRTAELDETEVAEVLQAIAPKLSPESVLVIYVRGRYRAIEQLAQPADPLQNRRSIPYYASANAPIPLVGAVVNAAYVADALRGED
jgi:hypothetical protein